MGILKITKTGIYCLYCEREILPPLRLTKEHLVAQSKGGNDTDKNVFSCCSDCNHWRSNKSLYYWREEIKDLLNTSLVLNPRGYTKEQLGAIIANIGNYIVYVANNKKQLLNTKTTTK